MSVKQCLMPSDHTKIKNAVSKNKPMSMAKQKMAEKQEKMFYDLNKDSGFQKDISGLKRMDKITAIQKKYAQNGVQITRQQVNKMMKNGVTIIKPSSIVMPKPTVIPKVIAEPVIIPKVPPKVVSIPKEIVPEIKPISKLPSPPMGAFQEAKTIDEALEQWGKYGYNKNPLDSYIARDWDKKKKLQTMNHINAQMDGMQKWTRGRRLGRLGFDDGDQQWAGKAGANQLIGNNHITMSTRGRFHKYGYGEVTAGRLGLRDFSTVASGNLSVTVRHEMGHVLWYDGHSKFRREFKDRIRTIHRTVIEKKISEYANKNVQECFAEVFCVYSSPKFKVGSLNKVFGGGFEELMENILIGAR